VVRQLAILIGLWIAVAGGPVAAQSDPGSPAEAVRSTILVAGRVVPPPTTAYTLEAIMVTIPAGMAAVPVVLGGPLLVWIQAGVLTLNTPPDQAGLVPQRAEAGDRFVLPSGIQIGAQSAGDIPVVVFVVSLAPDDSGVLVGG
jgi:hypothetical protein